jgi:lysophospholipase L1-like esterase
MRHRTPILIACALSLLAPAARMRADEPAAQAPIDARFQIPAADDGLPGTGPVRREAWFQKVWAERRAPWAAQVQQDQGALVFLGDSITQGWGDVGSSFPGIKIANRGISGDTTRGVLIRLQDDVIALNPRGVVILIGTNDIELKSEPEVIAGNLKLIIAALRAHNPSMPVILCEVLPSSATKNRPAEKIRRLNELYIAAVADQPQVTVLDTWSLFKDVHGDAKELRDARPAPSGHPRLREMGGGAQARPRDGRARPRLARRLPSGARLREPLQRPRPDRLGLRGAPSLTGKTSSDEDGRYVVKNGRLVVTVSHKGQETKKLWTTPGVSPRLHAQARVPGEPERGQRHLRARAAAAVPGLRDRRALRDARALPPARLERDRRHGPRGLAHCTCNGEVVVDAMPVPAVGPIGLESDRGQVEYRRIRVEEAR